MPCGGGGGGRHSPLFPGAGRVISFLDSQTPRRNDQTELRLKKKRSHNRSAQPCSAKAEVLMLWLCVG